MGNKVVCIAAGKKKTTSLDTFPAQDELDLDWSNESSIHSRTELNCMLNCTLGKLSDNYMSPSSNKCKIQRNRRLKNAAIKFAETSQEIGVTNF